MPTLVHDCPHCGASNSAFNIAYSNQHPSKQHQWNALGICPSCGEGIYVLSHAIVPNLGQLAGNLATMGNVSILKVLPRPEKVESPDHIPPAANRAFQEGVACLAIGKATAAAAMFRRCLEIALKAHSPDIEAWKLEKRIDKLFNEGRITKDLQEWAHRVRLDGNDALHEAEEFTKESSIELMEFTRMVLVYLYTLPEKIRLRIEQPGE
ncbi:DUF4145 domain-containing protein [Burkholderia sp. RS02]|uniref:DUF4145 domain-containing protein n=1 Tax=unclassified Burkholderia TaxID=2613784 RepID=UPI00321897FC